MNRLIFLLVLLFCLVPVNAADPVKVNGVSGSVTILPAVTGITPGIFGFVLTCAGAGVFKFQDTDGTDIFGPFTCVVGQPIMIPWESGAWRVPGTANKGIKLVLSLGLQITGAVIVF